MNNFNKNIISFILIFGGFVLNTFLILKVALGIFLLGFLMSGGLYRGIGVPLILTFAMGIIPYLIAFIIIYFLNKPHIKKIIIITLIVHSVECITFSVYCLQSLSGQI